MEKHLIKKLIAPNLYSILVLLLLTVILFFSGFFPRRVSTSASDTFVAMKLTAFLAQQSPVLISAIFSILALCISLLIVHINEVHQFIRERTIIPSLIFMVFITFSEYEMNLNMGLIGALFLLLAMNCYFMIYQKVNVTKSLFDSFFLLSIGSLFHIHLFFLSGVFLLATFFSGTFQMRHLFAAIIGYVTPLFFVTPIILVLGFGEEFIKCTQNAMALSYNVMGTWEFARIFYSVFFFIALIISIAFFYFNNLRDEIRTRRLLTFVFILTLVLCVLGLYQMKNFFTYYPLFILCISIVCGYYFTLAQSKFTRYFIAVFLATPVLFSAYSYLIMYLGY